MQESQTNLVPKDKFIVLIDNRGEQRLIRINDNKKFNWRKIPIALQQISKYNFYTMLDVSNHTLNPIDWQFEEEVQKEEVDQGEQTNNNKDIFLIDEAQKLQIQDIERMKKELKPSQIISELVGNNEQFSKRTEYSKAKYLKKKERKYIFKFHAEPSTLDSLHHYYFKEDHKAIGSIRWEMLGLLLLNASPFGKVLLAEQTKGILLGGALIRGVESITVTSTQTKNMRNCQIVEQLNISKQEQNKVIFTNWTELVTVKEPIYDNFVLLGNYNFVQIITEVQPLLKDGCIIAFFCLSFQPLQKCALLMRQKGYLNIKIQDVWSRDYQVLHNRTHPLMYMDSCSGYLLTGFKVT